MERKQVAKIQTDTDVKRKAIKQVVIHIKKKITEDYVGSDHLMEWINQIEELLTKEDFNIKEYIQARKNLNDIIERTLNEEIRFKLRDSWYSLGKALEKKAKIN